MLTVGLDVSTSCTGICVLDELLQPCLVGSVVTSHLSSLKDKASAVMGILTDHVVPLGKIGLICVEESLQAFRPGMSSANTICSLAKMNGLVSTLSEMLFCAPVVYVSSQTARKSCGIKIVRGIDAKKQVVEWATKTFLKSWELPKKKRSDDLADQVKDAADALVVALGGCSLITKKPDSVLSDTDEQHVNSLDATKILREDAGKDHCVKIWKGSVREMSISVVPISG